MVNALAAHKFITNREASLLEYFLAVLGDHMSEKDKQHMVKTAYKLLSREDE
jgi:transcriptional regulator CtsR